MKSYYSILKLSPNSDLNDSISIGLLLLFNNRYYFQYSEDLLRMLRPIFRYEYNGIEKLLKIVSRKINTMDSIQLDLYNTHEYYFNEAFLKKLHIQNQGMMKFSNPRPISLTSLTEESFSSLVKSVIGEYTKKKVRRVDKNKILIEDQLIRPLSEYIHSDITVNGNVIPGMYFRYKLECIGRSERIVMAKYFDFNQYPATLDIKLMHLLHLEKILARTYQTEIKTFILAEEPPSRRTKSKKIYDFIAANDNIELRTPQEALQVAKVIVREGAKKFLF